MCKPLLAFLFTSKR